MVAPMAPQHFFCFFLVKFYTCDWVLSRDLNFFSFFFIFFSFFLRVVWPNGILLVLPHSQPPYRQPFTTRGLVKFIYVCWAQLDQRFVLEQQFSMFFQISMCNGQFCHFSIFGAESTPVGDLD